MKARTLTLAALLLASVSLSAQEQEEAKESQEAITYSNITEFGFITTSIRGISFEGTTAHGIAINKTHYIGLGFGIGGCFYSSTFGNPFGYMPVFLNYRFYFKPEKVFSPHVNVSAGGLILDNGYGVYSSITMGFKAGKFSFSSGLSFMPMYKEVEVVQNYDYIDPWGNLISASYSRQEWKWSYPFGITLKWGFAF